MDYENMILARQDSEADDCTRCPYKGHYDNQCMRIEYGRKLEDIYPLLFRK